MMAVHWLRPEWLPALLFAPLVGWLAWRLHRVRDPWVGVIDPALRAHVLDEVPAAPRRLLSSISIALAITFAVLALAGPSWQRIRQPLQQSQSPLVIAVDLSSATLANDVAPSRLLVLRAALQRWLHGREGGQTALVAFADDAFTVTPLTDDPANIAVYLDALAPDVMPVDGQRPERAISRARDLMQQAGFGSGDIVLVTDHADGAASRAALAARTDGYRVSAIGLGSPMGGAVRTPDGRIRNARMDMASLAALATAGGGKAMTLAAAGNDLASLGLGEAASASGARHDRQGQMWQDNGYWLLLPLLLFLLPAFRRGGLLASALALALWAAPDQAHAADWWRRPDQQQHAHMEAGKRAYRAGDFARAEAEYAKAGTPYADYNRGNALAKQGRYEEAVQAYDQSLKRRPGMADAKANRDAVLAEMKKKPPPQGGQRQQSGPGQQGARSQPGQQSQQAGQSRQPQQGAQSQSGQPQPGTSSSSNTPANSGTQSNGEGKTPQAEDASAQQAANAAQRERMQREMQGAQANGKGETSRQPAAAETAAQREQRQQVEAWMRRIPDDPGALLRRKFMLEQERRRGGGG